MCVSESKLVSQARNGLASDNYQYEIEAMCVSLSKMASKS